MRADVTWQPQAPNLSLGKAVFLSLFLHVCLFLTLIFCDFIPIPKSQKRVITFKSISVTTFSANPAPKPKGIERLKEVTNPSPPTPPKPSPRPTPQTKPKPKIENKSALKPIPTPKTAKPKEIGPPKPKSTRKFATKAESKKILATPRPEPAPEPEAPEVAESPAATDTIPTIPAYKGPVVAPKGVKEGGQLGGVPAVSIEGGIVLPSDYLLDTYQRIQANFTYTGAIAKRYPTPAVCIVEFRVALDGTINTISVRQSSGNPVLDDIAKRTIKKTAQLRPLKDLIKADLGRDYVTATVPFSFGGTETIGQ